MKRKARRPLLINTDPSSMMKATVLPIILMILLIVSNVQTGFSATYLALGTLAAAGLFGIALIRTKRHVIRWIYSFVFFFGMPIASTYLLQSYTISPTGEKGIYPKMLPVNFAIMLLIFLLLTALTGSLRAGYAAALVVIMLIGVVNYFVVMFRGSPVMPWDVLSVKTAISVSSGYDYDLNRRFFWCTAGFFGMILLVLKMEGFIRSFLLRILLCLLAAAAFVFGARQLNKEETKNFLGMDQTLFTPNVCYRNNGFLATFVGNLDLLVINKPSGYSGGKIDEIVSKTPAPPATTTSVPKNVIVVMDEAFSDLSVLGDFETSEEVIPTFNRLKEECGGTLSVSVKGGNTANTEFEFLTGNAMSFLPTGAIPYQQYLKNETPSVASQMRYFGYETTAIHPYYPGGWNRDEVYPLLGFDEFLSKDDFENPETLRGYVTDGETFRKIEELIAERDVLKQRIDIMHDLINNASQTVYRARNSEIKILPSVNVRELQKKTDELSKQLRLTDTRIQELNWTVEL